MTQLLQTGFSLTTGWKIEKRVHTSPFWQVASVLIALIAAAGVSAILISLVGADLFEAFRALIRGAFGTQNALNETLVQSTPLVFTGLAVLVAFRGRIWNIGAEGQFFAGVMGTYWIINLLGEVPPVVFIISIIITACISGAIWGGIAGFLKAQYGANEIIVTVMMNFIITFILSFLLGDLWRDPNTFFYQSSLIPEAAFFPRLLSKGRLHIGFILALVAAVVVYILLWKTALGYEIRAMGINPTAAKYKGISIARTTILIMAISGALAGLGGGSEIAGLHHRLRLDISTGYGFTGIIIAMLGRLHPLGVVLAALFFGALTNGASAMQIKVGVPVAIVHAIQGIVLIFLLIAEIVAQYRIRKVADHV